MIGKIEQKAIEWRRVIYCFMFGVVLFMHFYKLASVPLGIHIDEAGMAYDAYCLADYSVDRYLNHLPVYLINFGGGQSALNAYLVAALIKLTGNLNTWIIRLPGAFIGIFSYIAGVNIIRKCFGGEKWGLVSSFLLAIFPYFIMQSRFGLDCNLLLGISTIGLYLLILADEKKKAYMYILAGVVWGISYYTYALSYLTSTLFLGILLCYWLYRKRITWKNLFFFGIPVFLIACPLLLMVIINTFDLPQINTPLFTIPRLPNYRNKDIIFTKMWDNLCITIKYILTKDWLSYNAFDKYFTMYRISIVFAVVGFFRLSADMIKNLFRREYSSHIIFWLLLIIYLFLGTLLGDDGPNINRLNGIFFALFYCVLYGMKYSYIFLKEKLQANKGKDTLAGLVSTIPEAPGKIALLVIIIYTFYFVTFANYYFNKYPEDIYPQDYFADTYKKITDFIETDTGEPKVVYTNMSYIYYLLSEKVDPFEADIGNKGTRTYWKYAFYLPQDIETGVIYIINNTDEGTLEYMDKLESMGFDKYVSGMLICYYKK
nr:glycosyltransferase family 39 protein [uncultured Eisenbergiella sp.]